MEENLNRSNDVENNKKPRKLSDKTIRIILVCVVFLVILNLFIAPVINQKHLFRKSDLKSYNIDSAETTVNIRHNLESLSCPRAQKTSCVLTGWSYLDTLGLSSTEDYQRLLVFDDGLKLFVSPLDKQTRIDVVKAFPEVEQDLSQAGFKMTFNKSVFPSGTYRIGLLVVLPGEDEQIQWTNWVLIRTKNTISLERKES